MYVINQNCNVCKNEAFCKWTQEMKNVQTQKSKMLFQELSPIKINVLCEYFQKKNEKQDGIYR